MKLPHFFFLLACLGPFPLGLWAQQAGISPSPPEVQVEPLTITY